MATIWPIHKYFKTLYCGERPVCFSFPPQTGDEQLAQKVRGQFPYKPADAYQHIQSDQQTKSINIPLFRIFPG